MGRKTCCAIIRANGLHLLPLRRAWPQISRQTTERAPPHGLIKSLKCFAACKAWRSLSALDVTPTSCAELSSLDRGQDEKGPQHVSGAVEVDLPVYAQTPKGIVTDDKNVAATITISVNDLSAVVQGGLGDNVKPYVDQGGRFFTSTAEPVDTLHGYPVYRVLNDQWVILRRDDVPFFVPVSRERVPALQH